MTTLITFLGRVEAKIGQYDRIRYRLPGALGEHEAAFVGWALQAKLEPRPQRLVVLGTAGSMWDHLFEVDHDLGDAALEERDRLIERVRAQQVDRELLARMAPVLAERLGCEVILDLIPPGRTEAEQVEVLEAMARHVRAGDTVHLDVTHGFRTLPMLGLLAALYLRTERGAEIGGIWYGEADLRAQTGQVTNLSGLLHIADWVEALAAFDKDGDYAVFAPLLRGALPEEALALLADAAFFERTQRIGQARGKLQRFLQHLDAASDALAGSTSPVALFAPLLRERIEWCREGRFYQRMRALAVQSLNRGDYVRATLFAFEAFVTREMQRRGIANPDSYDNRAQAKSDYEAEQKMQYPRSAEYEDYRLLRDLRNQLAHGAGGDRVEVQRAIADAATLHAKLEQLIGRLLPAA